MVNDTRDLFEDEQLRHREHFTWLDHPEMGPYATDYTETQLSLTPGRLDRPAPLLGQDTEYALREIVGFERGGVSETGKKRERWSDAKAWCCLFEFAIAGSPASQQTRRRERVRVWTQQVRETAVLHWDDTPPFDGMISVNILYVFDGTPLDVDNIPKPIFDALKGLVYVDDHQITDLICRKRRWNRSTNITLYSSLLRQFYRAHKEFIYVRTSLAPNLEVLL